MRSYPLQSLRWGCACRAARIASTFFAFSACGMRIQPVKQRALYMPSVPAVCTFIESARGHCIRLQCLPYAHPTFTESAKRTIYVRACVHMCACVCVWVGCVCVGHRVAWCVGYGVMPVTGMFMLMIRYVTPRCTPQEVYQLSRFDRAKSMHPHVSVNDPVDIRHQGVPLSYSAPLSRFDGTHLTHLHSISMVRLGYVPG